MIFILNFNSFKSSTYLFAFILDLEVFGRLLSNSASKIQLIHLSLECSWCTKLPKFVNFIHLPGLLHST